MNGKLRARVFPECAATLVKILVLGKRIIPSVCGELGPLKTSSYLPGLRILIYSDDELYLY